MNYYRLKFKNIVRDLPLVAIASKVRVASVNFLGDTELSEIISREVVKQIKSIDFDILVGPEVKVVPILHEATRLLGKKKYVVCRKNIHGYMVSPVTSKTNPQLVIDGKDADLLKGKRVVILDDVVSSGKTIKAISDLIETTGGKVVKIIAIFKQENLKEDLGKDFLYLSTLPVFLSH
ncbi:MAG: phosphoribosyltransferase family protein [Candidatus Microgenomates bacterium]|jgi:adenine phosphoribosyltransferase